MKEGIWFHSEWNAPGFNGYSNSKKAVSANRRIIDFFSWSALSDYPLDYKPYGNQTVSELLIELAGKIQNRTNLGTFLLLFGKYTKRLRNKEWVSWLYESVFRIILEEKSYLFEDSPWQAYDVWRALHGLQNSENVPLELFQAFTRIVPAISRWDGQGIWMSLYGLQNSDSVPTEIFRAFAKAIPTVSDWDSQGIWMALYGLQSSKNVPPELFQAFMQVIPSISHWDAQGIWMALYGLQNYINTQEGLILIDMLGFIASNLDVSRASFKNVQTLIIGIEHVVHHVPENILARWNELVEREGKSNSTETPQEQELIGQFRSDNDLGEWEILNNAFICGYEVDIALMDAQ